ncbi:CDP-alcohol phosphatidyltransferase superfamily protein [Toxoplasma gondii CAST]|uniref:CDP-alcohol phosphatidyltransferase superfamily protein n=1 Tax=Toxoplasma gondii CAST TaxID=943122 RepID=A0A3R7Z2Y5_TOXGO|nr:CDP-alcohol phosphatidyltransferase superfamily protein [Toxoplasma gondii CAST]
MHFSPTFLERVWTLRQRETRGLSTEARRLAAGVLRIPALLRGSSFFFQLFLSPRTAKRAPNSAGKPKCHHLFRLDAGLKQFTACVLQLAWMVFASPSAHPLCGRMRFRPLDADTTMTSRFVSVPLLLLLVSSSPPSLSPLSSPYLSPSCSAPQLSAFPFSPLAAEAVLRGQTRPLGVDRLSAASKPLGASACASGLSPALGRRSKGSSVFVESDRRRRGETTRSARGASRGDGPKQRTAKSGESRQDSSLRNQGTVAGFLLPAAGFFQPRADLRHPQRLGVSASRTIADSAACSWSFAKGSKEVAQGARPRRETAGSLGAQRSDETGKRDSPFLRGDVGACRPLQLSLRIETLPIHRTTEDEKLQKGRDGEDEKRREEEKREETKRRVKEDWTERHTLVNASGEATKTAEESQASFVSSGSLSATESHLEKTNSKQEHDSSSTLSSSSSSFSSSPPLPSSSFSASSSKDSLASVATTCGHWSPGSWSRFCWAGLDGSACSAWVKERLPTVLSSLRLGASAALFASLFFPRCIVPSSLRRTEPLAVSALPCSPSFLSPTDAEDKPRLESAAAAASHLARGSVFSRVASGIGAASGVSVSSLLSSASHALAGALGLAARSASRLARSESSRAAVLPSPLFSSLLFTAAGLTDFLDGFLARRWDVCSPLGALLDALADKLLVAAALGGVSALAVPPFAELLGPPAVAICMRELAVQGLRLHLEQVGRGAAGTVQKLGKVKTATQMTALSLLLLLLPLYTGHRSRFASDLAARIAGEGEAPNVEAGAGAVEKNPQTLKRFWTASGDGRQAATPEADDTGRRRETNALSLDRCMSAVHPFSRQRTDPASASQPQASEKWFHRLENRICRLGQEPVFPVTELPRRLAPARLAEKAAVCLGKIRECVRWGTLAFGKSSSRRSDATQAPSYAQSPRVNAVSRLTRQTVSALQASSLWVAKSLTAVGSASFECMRRNLQCTLSADGKPTLLTLAVGGLWLAAGLALASGCMYTRGAFGGGDEKAPQEGKQDEAASRTVAETERLGPQKPRV